MPQPCSKLAKEPQLVLERRQSAAEVVARPARAASRSWSRLTPRRSCSPSPCPCSSYPAAQKRPLLSQTPAPRPARAPSLSLASPGWGGTQARRSAWQGCRASSRPPLRPSPPVRLQQRLWRQLRRRRDRLRVRLAEPFRGMLKKCSSRFSCVYVCRYYVHIYKYPYISIFLISCGPAAPPLEQDARGGSRELLQDPRHWAKTLQVRGQSSMSPPKLRKATHSRTCAWALQRGRATAAGIYTFLRLARTAELPRGAWQRHSYIGPLFSSPFPP